ncbi:unnamed protein product, partial [Prorocentrum cordatum]
VHAQKKISEYFDSTNEAWSKRDLEQGVDRDVPIEFDRVMNLVEASPNHVHRHDGLHEARLFSMAHSRSVLAHFGKHQLATMLTCQIGDGCEGKPTPAAA